MIKSRMSADWSTTKPIVPFYCTPRVQDLHAKAEVVHLTPGLQGLGVLGECRALWGERSEAWYRVTLAADAEAATYVKRVYVDYI